MLFLLLVSRRAHKIWRRAGVHGRGNACPILAKAAGKFAARTAPPEPIP
jgi:hypothetical protein